MGEWSAESEGRRVRVLKRCALGAAGGVLAIGLLAMAGWVADIPALRQPGPGGLTIKANSALGLIILGMAALGLLRGDMPRWGVWICRTAALLVATLGLATLLQALVGAELGGDGMLFRERAWGLGIFYSNQMGLPAAVSFVLAGIALPLLDHGRPKGYRVAEILGAMVFMIGLLPTMWHLYGLEELYAGYGWTSTALGTSVGIMLLGLCIVLARPSEGMVGIVTGQGTAGTILRWLVLPVFLFPLLVGWVQVRLVRTESLDVSLVTAVGTMLVAVVLLVLLLGFGHRLGVAERDREAAIENAMRGQMQLNAALEGACAGAWEWDVKSDSLTWSRECYRLWGMQGEEPVTYASWMASVHPEDRVSLDAAMHDVVRGKVATLKVQYRRVDAAAEARWFESSGRVTAANEDGEAIRVTGITRDITREKQDELHLRRTAAKLELLYDTAVVLMSTDDPQQAARTLGRKVLAQLDCDVFLNYVQDADPSYLRLHAYAGIDEEEARRQQRVAIGTSVSGDVLRNGVRCVVENVAANSGDVRYERLARMGLKAYACHPLVAEGRTIGTIGFGSKTLRRFTLESLALMQAVANHVAMALQRARSQQELASANAAKDHLVSVLSQELRTPMIPVLESAKDLESDMRLTAEQRRHARIVRECVEIQMRLIDELMDTTRVGVSRPAARGQSVRVNGDAPVAAINPTAGG